MKAKKVSHVVLPFVLSLVALVTSCAYAQGDDSQAQLIKKGEYLAIAADCDACHRSPQGQAMAGGRAIASPLGNIIASNITPSLRAGIGDYSQADFARALRQGINKQGVHLYPAMPYTSYAKLTDDDIHALYLYFMHGVKEDDHLTPATHLAFPFNLRAMMSVWNRLFADPHVFQPQAQASALVNRGDYLVNGLAHCDTCHTPRNALMGAQANQGLAGGSVGSWYAPNITPDPIAGIGRWSDDELAEYLTTGRAGNKAQAAGPMAEAIEQSLQYLRPEDIRAIIAYLRQIPAIKSEQSLARDQYGSPADDEARYRADSQADAGWKVYASTCANCHQPNGAGNAFYPALFNNTATGAENADNLITVILEGVQRQTQGHPIAMPGYGEQASFTDRLSDQQIADVSNYVLKRFGNPQLQVTPQDVAQQRHGGKKPLIASITLSSLLTALVALLVLGVLAIRFWRKKRSRHVH